MTTDHLHVNDSPRLSGADLEILAWAYFENRLKSYRERHEGDERDDYELCMDDGFWADEEGGLDD